MVSPPQMQRILRISTFKSPICAGSAPSVFSCLGGFRETELLRFGNRLGQSGGRMTLKVFGTTYVRSTSALYTSSTFAASETRSCTESFA